MFFEVFDDPINTSGDITTKFYKTHLGYKQNPESIFALNFISDWVLPVWNVWYIEFVQSQSEKIITPTRVFPLWWGRLCGAGLVSALEWKWISAATECVLMSATPENYRVKQSRDLLTPRRLQLQSYWIENTMNLGDYLGKIKRSLTSPHFRIVKFPPWITDPKILQLSEKV